MRWFRMMAMVLVGVMLLTISGSAFAAVKDDTVFLKEIDIECNVGDKIQAIIVPIDLETKMASVSTIVYIEEGNRP